MMDIQIVEKCKYRLPCGWCDRTNKICSIYSPTDLQNINDVYSNIAINMCEHQWICNGVSTHTMSYECKICGEQKIEAIEINEVKI